MTFTGFKILLVNESKRIKTDEARAATRAMAKQLKDDYGPAWKVKASIKLLPKNGIIEKESADGIIFIRDAAPKGSDYAGYHDRDRRGNPLGYVFSELSNEIDEDWTVTLSHEVLELLGNRHVNYYALGKHPARGEDRMVLHWLELCDAVQDFSYVSGDDGVRVSDFVYPLYFTPENETGGKNHHMKGELKSFSAAKGGYIGFWDPKTNEDSNFFADARAKERFKIKKKAGLFRRRERVKKMIQGI